MNIIQYYLNFYNVMKGVWGFPQQAKWTKTGSTFMVCFVHFFVSAYALTVLANILALILVSTITALSYI